MDLRERHVGMAHVLHDVGSEHEIELVWREGHCHQILAACTVDLRAARDARNEDRTQVSRDLTEETLQRAAVTGLIDAQGREGRFTNEFGERTRAGLRIALHE